MSYQIIEKSTACHDDTIKWKHSRVTGPLCGEFTGHRWIPHTPVTRIFDVFFDLGLNVRLNKQSWGWWFETPSRPLWGHSNVFRLTKIHITVALWGDKLAIGGFPLQRASYKERVSMSQCNHERNLQKSNYFVAIGKIWREAQRGTMDDPYIFSMISRKSGSKRCHGTHKNVILWCMRRSFEVCSLVYYTHGY